MASAPIVLGLGTVVAPGATLDVSNLFQVLDLNGTVAGFDIELTAATGGTLYDNGTPEQSGTLFNNSGSTLGIPYDELSQWTFVAGPSATSGTIELTAIDASGLTASGAVTVATSAPPTIIGELDGQTTLATGSPVALSSLFDLIPAPITNSFTGFAVELNGNGTLTFNGTIEPSGTLLNGGNGANGIPYSEISQWDYVPGTAGSTGTIEFTAIEPGGIASTGTETVVSGATYVAGGARSTLDGVLNFGSAAPGTLTSATVAIASGFLAGDILHVGSPQVGITSSYNPSTGVLTLSGSASLAEYVAELDSVTYAFSPGDPTDGGTDTSRTIDWTISDGGATASATSSLTVNFDSEPSNDIMFQNSDGQVALWQVNGASLTASGLVGGNPGPQWFMIATGSFYTGDSSDILWQNADGQVAVWKVQGTSLLGSGLLGGNPGTSWHIEGTGNFYSDSNTDILWQANNGVVGIWDVNGTSVVQSGAVSGNPGPTWHVVGSGNFYGAGDNTILFQNDDGQVAMWEMNGTTIVASGAVSANPGSSWVIKGTGDFYGDGHTDILFQNTDGAVAIWDMTNGPTIEQAALIANPGTTWNVVGTGDFNNDGKTDIVFQNTNGQVAIWEMNGATIAAGAALSNPGTTWSVVDNTMRFIYSQGAGETLAATPAVADEFVFTSYAAGSHTITGFDPMQDVVAFSSTQFASYAAVEAATSAVAAGAMINLGQGSSLLLAGVDPSTLHASNFALS